MNLALGMGLNKVRRGALLNYLLPSLKAKFLFFGQTKNISDGKLLNEVGEDWLTVTGSAGSETFQVPNTAPYIAADTDYIWFKTDASQRTTTTAELVTYDLQRTPIKFDDSSPYALRIIAIFKAGETMTDAERNNLFRYFQLPILWDNNLNEYGHLKENRTGQNLWTPESTLLPILTDLTKTVAYFDFRKESSITKVGSLVSQVADLSGNNHHLLQAGADSAKPSWSADGLTFDGAANMIKAAAFTWNQPEFNMLVVKRIVKENGAAIMDGHGGLSMTFLEGGVNNVLICAPTASCTNTFASGSWGIVSTLFNGSSSYLKINEGAPVTGNPGANNAGGLTFGIRGDSAFGAYSNFIIAESIHLKIVPSTEEFNDLYNYLKTKYSL